MLRVNIDSMEKRNENLFSYVTEIKNLEVRVEKLKENIASNSYGSATSAIKHKLNQIHNKMDKERVYMNRLGNKLETISVKYQNAEIAIMEAITGKDYKNVTKDNNDVDKTSAKASTKDKFSKATIEYTDEKLQKALANAKSKVGNRYVWGGNDVDHGIDCSGFSQWFYKQLGITLPRTSSEQSKCGKAISAKEMQPGDLIFYGDAGRVSHVAIYIGNGQIVHASNSKDGIKISNYNYRAPITIRRITK